MKKWIGILPLCLLAVLALWASNVTHEWAWPFNFLPLLIWIALVALCQHRWPSLGNPVALLLGIGYGALAGIGAAAFLCSFLTDAFSSPYYRYPYDEAAYAIILVLASIAYIALAMFDYVKFQWQPLWVRIVTASVAFLPCILTAIHIMAYFEGILSKYVS